MDGANQCRYKSEWTSEPLNRNFLEVGFSESLVVTRDGNFTPLMCKVFLKVSLLLS